MGMPDIDVQAMTVEERLALIGILLDSLTEADVPLTPAQQAELDPRIAEVEANPHETVAWEVARARITTKATRSGPQS